MVYSVLLYVISIKSGLITLETIEKKWTRSITKTWSKKKLETYSENVNKIKQRKKAKNKVDLN